MATLTPRVVQTARGPIEFAEVGSGPAVLVVHGMPGDWRQVRSVADDLEADARVLLVSRPGYGRTPLRSGRSPVEQAALFAALLDTLEVEQVIVLGVSGGGPSAYAFAAGFPDRTRGLVLCCPVRGGVIEMPPGMRRLAVVPGLWSALAATARGLDAVRRRTGRTKTADLSGLTPTELQLLERPRVRSGLEVFDDERIHTLRGRGLRNDSQQLGALPPAWPAGTHVPAVVMHGDVDVVVPLPNGQAYADAIPGARLDVLEGYGHAVPAFARDELLTVLRDLLAP